MSTCSALTIAPYPKVVTTGHVQVRKLPLMHRPWEHAIAGGLGAYAGNWLVHWEERTGAELQELLQKREESNRRIPHNSK